MKTPEDSKVRIQYETITKVSIEEFVSKYKKALKEYNKLKDIKSKRIHRFIVLGENGKRYKLYTKSLRYRLFTSNTTCVSCGIEGEYFLLQKAGNVKKYHANLYGINKLGQEILMTKDHIVRIREGGKNKISNLQTMCYICNCIIKN